jgi:hypothetical protein
MHRAFPPTLLSILLLSGCGGARLSHNEIRRQVADIGSSTLVPKAVEVRRVVAESGNRAIAETTVELAFQFERDTAGSPWHISAVRLGDQNWLSLPELLAAVNESRKKETLAAMGKIEAGVTAYRERNGRAPSASTITALGDVLHPQYMKDLVVVDSWGRPMELETQGAALRYRSLGVDGQKGTSDDIVFPE